MNIKVLTGHLTPKDKQAIKAILDSNLKCGRVGKADYFISQNEALYTSNKVVKDRGLIPIAGSQLRLSTYKSTFIIN